MESRFGSPILFSDNHYFGACIAAVLEKNVYPDRNRTIIHKAFDKYHIPLTIYFPMRWLKTYRYGNSLSDKKVVFINKLIEEDFEEKLYQHCFYFQLMGLKKKNAIEDFCKLYGIEIDEDISYDNIIKTAYRLQKSEKYKLQEQYLQTHHKSQAVQLAAL